MPSDDILNLVFFLLEFFSLRLHFLKHFFYGICSLDFLLDDFITVGYSPTIPIDVSLIHLALPYMIFFAFKVLSKVSVENLKLMKDKLEFCF